MKLNNLYPRGTGSLAQRSYCLDSPFDVYARAQMWAIGETRLITWNEAAQVHYNLLKLCCRQNANIGQENKYPGVTASIRLINLLNTTNNKRFYNILEMLCLLNVGKWRLNPMGNQNTETAIMATTFTIVTKLLCQISILTLTNESCVLC